MNKLLVFVSVMGLAQMSLAAKYSSKSSQDSDSQICSEIRDEAADSCSKYRDPETQTSCYQSEVMRMVSEYNDETSDLSGGGDLKCRF